MTPEQIPTEARDEAKQFRSWLFDRCKRLSDVDESELASRFDGHAKQIARDILAENARMRELLQWAVDQCRLSDSYSNTPERTYANDFRSLVVKARAALAARGE